MDNTVINHPDYYKRNGLEAIDIIEEYALNFSEGCVLKYLWRMGLKDGEVLEKDQKKALWYFDREVSRLVRMERHTFSSCGGEATEGGCMSMAKDILLNKFEKILMRDDLRMIEAMDLLKSHVNG